MKMSARGENGQNEKTHVRMQGRVSHGQTDTSSESRLLYAVRLAIICNTVAQWVAV